jgi:peptidoglycan-associated lipoprotein
MRLSLSSLAVVAALLTGCHKKPPAVAPSPSTEPQPAATATPAPAAQPAAPIDRAACEMAITTAVAEIGRAVNFDTDKYEIRPVDAPALDAKIEVLRTHAAVRMRITGHADERYTDEYNLILGTRRAEAVKDYLLQKGIDGSRIETASLGETAPVDPAHTEEAWAKNRRAEFTVIAGRETLASQIAGCR